jgi:hypothetical protein
MAMDHLHHQRHVMHQLNHRQTSVHQVIHKQAQVQVGRIRFYVLMAELLNQLVVHHNVLSVNCN